MAESHDISLPLPDLHSDAASPLPPAPPPAVVVALDELVDRVPSPPRLRPAGIPPRPLSNTRGRSPAEDGLLPRAPSRTKTPAGKRKVMRFLNDNLVSVAAILGGAHSAEDLAATLEHLTLKLSHRSFLEPLLGDRDALRSYRCGEAAAAPPPQRQRGTAGGGPPDTAAGVLRDAYLRVPRRLRPLLLAEARRAAAGAAAAPPRGDGSRAEPTLLVGLELLAMLLLDGALAVLDGLGDDARRQLLGSELSGSLAAPPRAADAALVLALDDSYSSLLLTGVAAFYGLQLRREPARGCGDGGGRSSGDGPDAPHVRHVTLSRAAGAEAAQYYARLSAVRRAVTAVDEGPARPGGGSSAAATGGETSVAAAPQPSDGDRSSEATAASEPSHVNEADAAAAAPATAGVAASMQGSAAAHQQGALTAAAAPPRAASPPRVANRRGLMLTGGTHGAPPLVPLLTLHARSLGS